jgi:hypothetical protein
MKGGQFVFHTVTQMGIEISQGFIHQHRPRSAREAPRKRYTLSLATRQIRWLSVCQILKRYSAQMPQRRFGQGIPTHASASYRESDIFGHTHVRPKRVRLKNNGDTTPLGWAMKARSGNRSALQTNRSRICCIQSSYQAQQRAFSAA